MPTHLGYLVDMPKNKTLRQVLGENVIAVMRARRINQVDVETAARNAGTPITQSTISRVRRGLYPATLDTVEAVANGCGVDPWQLLTPGFRVAEVPLSERELEEVNKAKAALEGLSTVQRDILVRDGVMRDFLTDPEKTTTARTKLKSEVRVKEGSHSPQKARDRTKRVSSK